MEDNHTKTNLWCLFPHTRCCCSGGYRRLIQELDAASEQGLPSSSRAFSLAEETVIPVLLQFFNNDMTFEKVLIQPDLRASDLCDILAVKNRVPKDPYWCIVFKWEEHSLQRSLEDHEDVLEAYRWFVHLTSGTGKLFFNRNENKYNVFLKPQIISEVSTIFFDYVTSAQSSASSVKIGDAPYKYPQLKADALVSNCNDDNWDWRHVATYEGLISITSSKQEKQICEINHINSIMVYTVCKSSFAEQNSLCIIPCAFLKDDKIDSDKSDIKTLDDEVKDKAAMAFVEKTSNEDTTNNKGNGIKNENVVSASFPQGSIIINFSTEAELCAWESALRIAKYKDQLFLNIQDFKKHLRDSMEDNTTLAKPTDTESMCSHVAMDFTGCVGRIVDDPLEAQQIANEGGHHCRQIWRPSKRPTGFPLPSVAYLNQPWFHQDMTRDRAAALVKGTNHEEGLFLVRESHSNHEQFVLTYCYNSKAVHCRLISFTDEARDCRVWSLDGGNTRFFDIPQLIEFYQLNKGALGCQLTEFVNSNASQREEAT